MKKEHKISDELLVKYLLGEATEVEQGSVRNWIGENAGNKDRLDSLRLIWDQSKYLAVESAVDEEYAWAQFKELTRQPAPATKNIPLPPSYKWLKVAAVLLMLAGGGWLAYFLFGTHRPQIVAYADKKFPVKAILPPSQTPATSIKNNDDHENGTLQPTREAEVKVKHNSLKKAYVSRRRRSIKTAYSKGLFSYNKNKEFICNNTPCPFEICIIQTLKCKNDQPSAISTCSVLEPDQSGQLRYKAFKKIAGNCRATVDEIRITRISTGETIVLNDHSKPSTAQDFFNHITGKKKGEVVAGMFHTDCNNAKDDCELTFDSNYGNLILQ